MDMDDIPGWGKLVQDPDMAGPSIMNTDETFHCAYCFEPNSVFIDASGGTQQSYVEDCQVCCRPNVLFIHWNEFEAAFEIQAEPES